MRNNVSGKKHGYKLGGLIKKEKKMDGSEDMIAESTDTGWAESIMNRGHGGTIMLMSLGRIPRMCYHREERPEDSNLIQGTDSQVRARHFNNNDGEGTF